MARFYNTSQTDFIDYEEVIPGSSKKRPTSLTASSLVGDLEVLPEDRVRLGEIISEYDDQINNFTTQLQQNPTAAKLLAPEMQKVGQSFKNEYQAGELAAMRTRFERYKEQDKYISTALKDDPQLLQIARSQIQIDPLNFDRVTGTFGDVKAPAVIAPFTEKDKREWVDKTAALVKEDILGRVTDKSKLDKYTSILEVGEEYGVTKDKVIGTMINMVTPEMIRAEQQKSDMLGLGIDEASFYDPNTGELNLNTTYGQLIAGAAAGLSAKKRNTQFIKDEDEAGLEGLKRGTLKYGRDLDVPEAEFLAKKVYDMWSGEGSAFSGTMPNKMTDKQGKEVGTSFQLYDNMTDLNHVAKQNGVDIKHVKKSKGNVPIVTYTKKEEIFKNGVKRGEQIKEYTVPMNANFFRDVLPAKTFGVFMERMQGLGGLNESNDFNIDYTKDIGTKETTEVQKPTNKKNRANVKVPGIKY